MEWLKKLSSAISYIEENLDKEISYDKTAEIACCSTYYFQRMFSYVAGIPLSDYIRRRKRVCKINCVNHHRLFDTPTFCIMHNGFDNTVISWKKLVEKILGGNSNVTGN